MSRSTDQLAMIITVFVAWAVKLQIMSNQNLSLNLLVKLVLCIMLLFIAQILALSALLALSLAVFRSAVIANVLLWIPVHVPNNERQQEQGSRAKQL